MHALFGGLCLARPHSLSLSLSPRITRCLNACSSARPPLTRRSKVPVRVRVPRSRAALPSTLRWVGGRGERSRHGRRKRACGHVKLEAGTRQEVSPDIIWRIHSETLLRFVNRTRFTVIVLGEALGTSAALCTVCSHCVIALLRRGDGAIHFALQALQLYATLPIRLRPECI
jgi:hypothetical protein